MELLPVVFGRRANLPHNRQMVKNIGTVAAIHERDHLGLDDPLAIQTNTIVQSQLRTVGRGGKTAATDNLLAQSHHVDAAGLQTFTAGGTVLDLGAGRSKFLDTFKTAAVRLAADYVPDNLSFQKSLGNQVLNLQGQGTRRLPANSVRLLVASQTIPYWAASTTTARQTALEVVRLLEPGGIALIGPTVGHLEQDGYEHIVQAVQRRRKSTLAEIPQNLRYVSHVKQNFLGLLYGAKQAGVVEIASIRAASSRDVDTDTTSAYPDYLMVQKLMPTAVSPLPAPLRPLQ